MSETDKNRRQLATRSAVWAKWLGATVAKTNISPNQISVLSIVPALLGAWLLACTQVDKTPVILLLIVLCIQLRLLCNMLDGLVAIEGGKQSKVGILYNEIPDRIADSLLIVALGYAIAMPWLGWLGALLAAKTAYIRLLGGANGLAQDFRGPLAKQHRMFVLSLGCLIAAVEWYVSRTQFALVVTAYVIAVGAGLTCITRALAIAEKLKQQ
ncbi:MAG: CDP-diacylglycerol--glycerol-3-phosphate 3-phosphatidyltransferase [Methylotenera sp.]|nr:MAG: CDP-diacylglycerol--glycerol-3-phosphate 3-phosphatidyltransferase [Methylotenera sp.]